MSIILEKLSGVHTFKVEHLIQLGIWLLNIFLTANLQPLISLALSVSSTQNIPI
jgi:hypothetical protein